MKEGRKEGGRKEGRTKGRKEGRKERSKKVWCVCFFVLGGFGEGEEEQKEMSKEVRLHMLVPSTSLLMP